MGRTPGEAFMWCYRAERACRMQLAIQQAYVDTVALPNEVIEQTIERNRFLNSPDATALSVSTNGRHCAVSSTVSIRATRPSASTPARNPAR